MLSITSDDGVKKRVIKAAPEPAGGEANTLHESIQAGVKVEVEYVGRIFKTQKEFDRSVEGYPFSFTLGQGKVIEGWEIAVRSMKVGEYAEFFIASKYGYGENGDKSKDGSNDIPPDSDLLFEIKLLSAGLVGGEKSTVDEDLARLELLRAERAEAQQRRKEQEEEKRKKKEAAQNALKEKLRNKANGKKGGKSKKKKK